MRPPADQVAPAPNPAKCHGLCTYGVNSGVGRAARALRRLVGASGDGPPDAALVAAVRNANAHDLIVRLCDERLSFLKRLKTWPVFGAGWSKRVAEVRATALAMASEPPPSAAARHGTVAGGILITGAAVAQQAQHAGMRPVVVANVVIATVTLLVCVWLVWRWRTQKVS